MGRIIIHCPSPVEQLTKERYEKLTGGQLRAILEGEFSKEDVIGCFMAVQPEWCETKMVAAEGEEIKVLVFTHDNSTYFETTIAITICGQTYIEWDTLVSG